MHLLLVFLFPLLTNAFSYHPTDYPQCTSPLYAQSINCSASSCLCGEDTTSLFEHLTTDIEKLKADFASQLVYMQKMVYSDAEKLMENALNDRGSNKCKVPELQTTEASPGPVMANCREILGSGRTLSGLYRIQPRDVPHPFSVLCDMDTKLGGWEVVMKRYDGSLSFERTWDEYKNGFGNLEGEFWLGLEKLYQLTNSYDCEMQFQVIDGRHVVHEYFYPRFRISSEMEGYKITMLQSFSGVSQDKFLGLREGLFSTPERNNDYSAPPCPLATVAGWWFKRCADWVPTGTYLNPGPVHYVPFNQQAWVWEEAGVKFNPARFRMLVRVADQLVKK